MLSAGQKCTATSRAIVERALLTRSPRRWSQRVRALRVGDPLGPASKSAPSSRPTPRQSIAGLHRDRRHEGGRSLIGGHAPAEPGDGNFVAPTLFDRVDPGDDAWPAMKSSARSWPSSPPTTWPGPSPWRTGRVRPLRLDLHPRHRAGLRLHPRDRAGHRPRQLRDRRCRAARPVRRHERLVAPTPASRARPPRVLHPDQNRLPGHAAGIATKDRWTNQR